MQGEDRSQTSDTFSWLLLLAMAGLCLVACHARGFSIDARQALPAALGLAALVAAVVIGRYRRRPRLLAGATAFVQMTAFTLLGVVLAYVLAAQAGPLWDARLAAADRALGFDWPALWRLADRGGVLVWLGGVAYASLTVQMIVFIVVLSATRRVDTLRIGVAAAILSGLVTILISRWVPAMGNVFDPAGYHHLAPSIAWQERGLITGLRDGSLRVLDLARLMGIVSFPSYHATLPLIFVWGQRDVPVIRVVGPFWAALTILATPLFGGHYGVDVLAGMALAPLSIALCRRIVVLRPGAETTPSPFAEKLLYQRRCDPVANGVGDDVD